MNINRKQFLGSLLAGAVVGCTPTFASSKYVETEQTEFEKCKNDILYFVDNYLEVNNPLHGKLTMTKQQREYLKRISTAPDFFFCAKGRQIGISTANNVFAYWKTIFFGPNHQVFIVEPNNMMCKSLQKMYYGVANSGFMPLPSHVHFIKPSIILAQGLMNENNTYIFDEFDFWNVNHCLDRLSKNQLNRFLMNSLWAKELSPEQFEKFRAHVIVSSSISSYNGTFIDIMISIDKSRFLVLPNPKSGLKA